MAPCLIAVFPLQEYSYPVPNEPVELQEPFSGWADLLMIIVPTPDDRVQFFYHFFKGQTVTPPNHIHDTLPDPFD